MVGVKVSDESFTSFGKMSRVGCCVTDDLHLKQFANVSWYSRHAVEHDRGNSIERSNSFFRKCS